MSKLQEILDGWGNRIKDEFGMVDPEIKKRSEQRLKICNSCEIRMVNTCSPKLWGEHTRTGILKNGCGCNIAAKTLSPTSECPLGRWLKYKL